MGDSKRSGTYGNYRWIEWNAQFLYDLIAAFPEIVRGQYVVITSFDSGPFRPTEEEVRAGWRLLGDYAHSPKIDDDITTLPHDQYDEWYIFTQSTHLNTVEVFINYAVFSLQDPGTAYTEHPSSMVHGIPVNDWIIARRKEQERFWTQLHAIAPETYLAEGDFLLLVTRNTSLYDRVRQWVYPRTES